MHDPRPHHPLLLHTSVQRSALSAVQPELRAPELAACVLALLELSASEAAVERSFSRQGLVHSKQRNRLSDDTVHLSMAFAFNRRALQHSTARSAQGWEELLDEQPTVTDIVRGTSLLYTEDITAAAEESEDDGISECTPLNDVAEASTVHAEAEAASEAEAEVLYRMEQEEERPLAGWAANPP